MNKRLLVLLTGIVLFIIPFFWLPKGFADLGGDGIRIYFLDPIAFIKNFSLFNILPYYSYIPHIWVLSGLFMFVKDVAYRIAISNGVKLSLSFFSMFLFLSSVWISRPKKNIREHLSFVASYTGSVVYISFITAFGWYQSLLIHYNILLNPLLAYTILSYLYSKKPRYLILFIAANLLFSPNFGFTGFPQLISFFALFTPFAYFYYIFVLKTKFPFKEAGTLLLLFVGINAYHLVPTIQYVFDSTGAIYARTFVSGSSLPKSYFFDVNQYVLGGLSRNIFAPAGSLASPWLAVIIPLLTIGGLLKSRSKLQVLTGGIFLIGLYLVSANVTHAGSELYRLFYSIPGFSMFQYFNEKWYHAFAFFYVLLFALSFHYIFAKTKKIISVLAVVLLLVLVVMRNIPFFLGDAVRSGFSVSSQLTPVVKFDSDFNDSIRFVRSLPKDGKMLSFPLTFPYVQIIFGESVTGIYAGPSPIPILSGKSTFAGFWMFGNLEKQVEQSILNKDYQTLIHLISVLNIRYIFYNSDDRVMSNFSGYPYYTVEEFPALRNQKSYGDLLSHLPVKPIYHKGYFTIYEIDRKYFKSLISLQDTTVNYTPDWPGHYSISLIPDSTSEILIFREPFNRSWNLHFNGNSGIRVLNHYEIDGYTNAFLINVPERSINVKVTGEIRNVIQNYFIIGSAVSLGSIAFCVFYFIHELKRRKNE